MLPASKVIASCGSLWRWSTRALRRLVVLLLALWSVLLAAWLILQWGILPRINEWRPRIEALATRSLGVPVHIGAIRVRSGGLIPAAEIDDVVLHDQRGREVLRLPRVYAALSVPSLLALKLRFEQLLIDGAELVVRRDAQGRISVGGLELSGDASSDDRGNPAADWFFAQREFVIRGTTLTWIDEQRRAPPLQLTDAVAVMRNGLRAHDLRIDATPPAAWGERFSLRARMHQPLVARAGDWRRWHGTLYAELPQADIAQLRAHVRLPFELDQGHGALRAWIEWDQGRAEAATVDVALRDVSMRLSRQVQPLQFEHLSGRVEGEYGVERARVAAQRLTFATTDGVRWADSRFDAGWRLAAGANGQRELDGGEFSADRLDLASMAAIAARVPIGEAARHALAELAPRGTLHDIALRWDGPLDEPRQYQARARIKGLSLAAGAAEHGVGRPGLLNADIDLQANDIGGDARLVLADGALEFPGIFEQAVVPLRQLDAQLSWRIGAPRPQGRSVEVRIKEARFQNDDARGELSGTWRTGTGSGLARGGRFPGVLDLRAKLADAQATKVARYLPLGLPADTRSYVERAVQGGTLTNASVDVRGDLWDFPFHGPQAARESVFRIAGQARDLTFAYVPDHPAQGDAPAYTSPWPAITEAEGLVVVDRGGMSVRDARGRLFGTELRGLNVQVRNLAEPVFAIEGQALGPLADMLRYVETTPVREFTGGALTQAAGSGAAELRLALQVPLKALENSTVQGSLQLTGNDLRLRPDVPLLANARGRVDFTHKGVRVVGATARALGGDIAFDGGTQADGSLRFNGRGQASAEGLRRAAELPLISRLAASMQGQTAYRLQIGVAHGQPEFQLSSNLVGLASSLPAPFGKPADAALPLRVQTALLPETPLNPHPRDRLRVDVGPLLQALYLRELGSDGPRVLRGALAINTALPLAVPGVQAAAEFAQPVSLDAWRAVLFAPGAAESPGADTGAAGYVPRRIALRAREVVAFGRRFTAAQADLQRKARDGDDWWHAELQSDQLAGSAEYRESRGDAPGQLQARLTRAHLVAAEPVPAVAADSLPVPVTDPALAPRAEPGDLAPSAVPAMDVVIDDLEWNGRKLGRLEVEAVARVVPVTAQRQWRLQRLSMRSPDATLNASGQWTAAPGAIGTAPRRTTLDVQLDLADSGAFVERMGFGKTLRGGKGTVQGQLAWTGSPLAFDLAHLDGQLTIALDNGQFLKADAGAARLLGVLSLQALPRRLLLDFRDVFQEGFAFDKIEGDVKLGGGVAGIQSLRMRGVNATVLMDGKADLERETQDLRVFVVPEINAGTASLAYAAINPALGLGTFVAQWLLRRPLIAANTREFRVTGSWDEPKVDRIERKLSDAPGGPVLQ